MSDHVFLVDDRIGSKDLLAPLQRMGVPAELARLEFGDFSFIGRGPEESQILIGIELKETNDLISSLRSDRFAGHQLPGLLRTYDRVWLLTEGIWRADPSGTLETFSGGWRAPTAGRRPMLLADLEAWLLTQIIRGGLQNWHTATRFDTLRFLSVLYHWWTSKALTDHKSHAVIYHAPLDRASFAEPSTFLKLATCLPGVGYDKAVSLETHFAGSFGALMAASLKELEQVEGIGKVLARRIVETFHIA